MIEFAAARCLNRWLVLMYLCEADTETEEEKETEAEECAEEEAC